MSKYLPVCLFALGAYVFNMPGDQLILALLGGQLIGLSFVVGFYEYRLRRK